MTKISFLIIVFAVVFLSGCIGETDIIRGNEGVFDIEINNTNLAPSVSGETSGTGERVQGVTYYANETPIEIFVWGHGQNVSQTAELHLFINGTKVADTSGRPLGASEQSNKTIVAMIPKYASYKIEANNAHHYEWREYRVIAGTNGSVSITNNYFNTTGNGSGNASCDNCINATQLETNLSTKVNKSGDTMTGNLSMTTNEIQNASKITVVNTNYNLTSGLFAVADIYMVSAGSTVGFYSFGNVNSFSAYRFNNNASGDYSYLTTNQQILSFAVGGFNASHTITTNATAGTSRGGMNIVAADNWNETYQPTKTVFLNSNGSVVNTAVTFNKSNNLEINLPGKGIQLTSPNGLSTACITLNNAGVLTTTAGVCT